MSAVANLALAAGLGYYAYSRPRPDAGSPAGNPGAAAAGEGGVEALGRIQPSQGVINVFGVPGDRILELKVKRNSEVKKGDLLAVLSGEKERESGLNALTAQQAEAGVLKESILKSKVAKIADLNAEFAQAEAKANSEIAALKSKIEIIKVQKERAKIEYDRLQDIKSGSVLISAQDLLQAESLLNTAKLELAAAEEQLQLATKQMDVAKSAKAAKLELIGAETARALAQMPTDSVAAGVEAARQKVDSGRLKAPVGGRVVKLSAETGDTLTTMPVMQIADTAQISIVAEVYETRVAELRGWLARAGGGTIPAEIDARVLGENSKFTGTVTADGIAPMIAKNSVFPLGPREDTDRRVVEVEIRMDEKASEVLSKYLGLQVRARILPPK